MTSWRAVSANDEDVALCPCPNGPTLVRGADLVVSDDATGHRTAHPVRRPVVAVCICEKSQRWPWCDGTHKSVRTEG